MKKLILKLVFLFSFTCSFAFDWPVKEFNNKNITSYFGQKRGNTISTSLILSNVEEAQTIETGTLLVVLTEEDDDTFFPSTLGNSIIISHEDNLLSVYGNLDSESLTKNVLDANKTVFKAGETLASTGHSGYQDKEKNLEFQIIDLKESKAINPKLLMPRTESELPLFMSNLKVENKNKDFFDINTQRTFPSSLYKIYIDRNPIATPYKTYVSINGIDVDFISFDTIGVENNKLYIMGKKKYLYNDLYPNDTLQLIGEATFTPGKLALGLMEEDYLGKQKIQTYNLTIY